MNSNDYGSYLRNKFGSSSGFALAAENGMIPVPAGGKIGTAKSIHSGIRSFSNRLKPTKFKFSPRGVNSTNKWIRFLQQNKGKFKGPNYMQNARRAYYAQ